MKKKLIFIFLMCVYLGLKGQTPTLSCPSDITINTFSDAVSNYNCSTLITAAMNLNAITTNSGSCTLNHSLTGATIQPSGSGSVAGVSVNKGITTVNYFLNGCSASPNTCSFNITVNDLEAPRLTYTATLVYDTCSFSAVPAKAALLFTENCAITENNKTCKVLRDIVTDEIGCSTKAANLKYIQKCVRTWLCTDDSGNTSTFTQTHYLRDNKSPTAIAKPGFVIRGNTNVSYAATNFNDGSFDNCGGVVTLRACIGSGCTNYSTNITITSTHTAGLTSGQQATWPIGFEVTDICGNKKTTTTTIVVQRL